MTHSFSTFFLQIRGWQIVFLLFAVLFLHGCGGRSVAPVVYHPPSEMTFPEPAVPGIGGQQPAFPKYRYDGPAGPLYRKAKTFLDHKEYGQAELAMERALRIEPKNGYYWYTLAEIKFADKQYARMKQLCLKSKSLASGDVALIQLNDQLMAKGK